MVEAGSKARHYITFITFHPTLSRKVAIVLHLYNITMPHRLKLKDVHTNALTVYSIPS